MIEWLKKMICKHDYLDNIVSKRVAILKCSKCKKIMVINDK